MDTPKSDKFEVFGVNHLALMSSDMDRTVHFYRDVLGFPLVKTLEMDNGGQHFFFDISDGNGIAFFWMPESPPPAPGIAGAGWDAVTGLRSRVSAIGSMHHLSFDVAMEKLEEYRDRLQAAGVEVTEVTGTSASEDGDVCIKTIYFPDPDAFVLGFAAWTRVLTPADVRHAPASARVPAGAPGA
jgi:catechol 2,3-dioxygenase-like lactoylglutathione lyase family enzyme